MSGLHWCLLLVPNVLLPNLPQPLPVSPTCPLFSSPKFSPPPCSPTFSYAGTSRNQEKQSSTMGSSLERLNFSPNPPDKEGWVPGTARDERERCNRRVGSLSFWLVPIFLPCATHEPCPTGRAQPLAQQPRGTSLAKPHLHVSAPSACRTNHKPVELKRPTQTLLRASAAS